MAQDATPLGEALTSWLHAADPVPAHIAARQAETAGRPGAEMMTHPDVGRLLEVLVRLTGGARVLEIGTFVGISAAWIAGALAAGGLLQTLEADPARAASAEAWLRRVVPAAHVEVLRGDARETLRDLPTGVYDLAYVDADKTSYPDYLRSCLRLVRPGGVIVADNIFLGGSVGAAGERPAAMRRFVADAMTDQRLTTRVLPLGDGVSLSVVAPR